MRKGPIYRSSSSSSNTSNTSIKTTGSSASINENNDFESCGGSGGYNNNNNNDDVTADIINNHRTKTTNVNNNNNNNNNNINTINNNNNNLETISLSSHTSSSSFKYLYSVNSISESELEQDYQNERQQFLCDNNNNNNNNHAIGGGGVSGVNKKLTYVQRMKQQFEVLASAEKNSSNNCQKCNWWIKSPQSGIVDNEQFTIETPSAASTTLNESEHIFQRHTRVIKKKSDWLNHRQSNASSAALIENEINNNNINNINANDDDENGCRIVKIKESLICPAVIIPKIDYRQLISDEQKNAIKEEEEAEEEEENVAVVTVEEQEKNEVIENEEEIDENIEVDDTADVVHTINIHSEEQLSDFEENDVQQMSEEIIDTTNQIIFKEVNVHVANDHDIDADDVDADADDNFSDSFDSHTSDEDEDMENKNTLKVQETPRPDSLSSVSSNKLTNIIQELLENEETYIKSLRHGVEGYISIFNERNLPNTLRGQKYSIFGNIERIKSFHANEFYPALQKCSEDIEKIAQTFIKYIQEDYFYYYVLYAINRDKSERMCELNKDFFKERQNTIGDKLGINSFLVQPIQRLPKYSLLLNELIKELGKNLENSKDPIAACCIAQKNIQRLLDTVNESMSINDVIECNDINIHHQGKFQKVSKFDIWDSPLRKKYQGKVFLFDKCVIYTEILDEKRLHFRGYFPRETTGFTFEDGRNKFILYVSKRGQQEIEFSADFTTIQLWIKLLTTMLMKTVELEKQKIEEKRRQRHSTAIEGGTLNVIVRINSANSKHSTSTISNNTNSNSSSSNSSTPWTSGGSRESGASVSSVMSTNSNHSRTSSDSNRTTWDDRRTSERLLNSEKYYVNNLQKLTKIYLGNLPKLMNEHLQNFIKSTENILSFHYNIFYHSIKRCNSNGGAIFEVFKDKFDEHKFDDYIVHAAYANYAKHLLGNHYMNNSETECLSKTIDNFIFLPMRHIKNYNMLFECMMNEIKVRDNQNDTVSEAFKSGAVAEVKLRHLRKYMQENYNLNSIKGQSNCLVKDWGLVKYSDEVIVEGKCSRLLILEHALCCVKIKTSSKTKEEKFTDQVFLIPLTAVGILEKKPYPKRLIVLPSYAKTRYLIEFTTVNKKNRILAHIPNVKRKYKD